MAPTWPLAGSSRPVLRQRPMRKPTSVASTRPAAKQAAIAPALTPSNSPPVNTSTSSIDRPGRSMLEVDVFTGGLFDGVSAGAIAACFAAGLVLATEVGFRIGRWRSTGLDEPAKGQVGAIQAAELALLGLFLAFTFSMAGSRYDARKQLVIDEANAIGTAYLRASLLPSAE